jgi:hypothetical protein
VVLLQMVRGAATMPAMPAADAAAAGGAAAAARRRRLLMLLVLLLPLLHFLVHLLYH